jgi:hypothetical protein
VKKELEIELIKVFTVMLLDCACEKKWGKEGSIRV